MATDPSSLLIKSLNNEEYLPPQMMYVVCKQLFRYGVKSLVLKGSQVHVNLSYTPKTVTLIKKFGTLPIEYIRLALQTAVEVAMFEQAMAKFSFSARCDVEEIEVVPSPKRIRYDVTSNETAVPPRVICNIKTPAVGKIRFKLDAVLT